MKYGSVCVVYYNTYLFCYMVGQTFRNFILIKTNTPHQRCSYNLLFSYHNKMRDSAPILFYNYIDPRFFFEMGAYPELCIKATYIAIYFIIPSTTMFITPQ
jgi:hypothetical protein